MHKLLERVEKELENIADKGLNSSNLETTYKLIDIYKDIHEAKYYKTEVREDMREQYDARQRDSRGRFMENGYNDTYNMRNGRGYNDGDYIVRGSYRDSNNYGHFPMLDERTERHLARMREGMENYQEGRSRYRNGDSQERMVEGIEMTMSAICMFIESLTDFAETPKEKEVIRKHLEKIRNI